MTYSNINANIGKRKEDSSVY